MILHVTILIESRIAPWIQFLFCLTLPTLAPLFREGFIEVGDFGKSRHKLQVETCSQTKSKG